MKLIQELSTIISNIKKTDSSSQNKVHPKFKEIYTKFYNLDKTTKKGYSGGSELFYIIAKIEQDKDIQLLRNYFSGEQIHKQRNIITNIYANKEETLNLHINATELYATRTSQTGIENSQTTQFKNTELNNLLSKEYRHKHINAHKLTIGMLNYIIHTTKGNTTEFTPEENLPKPTTF